MLGQQDYTDLKTRPHLRRTADGDVAIGGGIEVLPKIGPNGGDRAEAFGLAGGDAGDAVMV